MLVIGIDPGITGSICFFEDGKIIDLIEMPNMADGKKQKRQVRSLRSLVNQNKWLEKN